MERSINNTLKDVIIILFLATAFLALLWAPFEWISIFDSKSESYSTDAWRVAQKFQHLWPILVASLLAGAFFAYKSQTWILGVLIPTLIAASLIGILTFLSYIMPLIFVFYVPGGPFTHFLLIFAWPYLFYLIMRVILIRWFLSHSVLTHSRLERFALFTVFGVPQTLCHFGFFINHDWYITFP